MRRGSSIVGEGAVTRGTGVTSLAGVVSGRGAGVALWGDHLTAMPTNPLDEALVPESAGELVSACSMATGWIWM